MQGNNSLEKSLVMGKIEGRRRRGQQRIRWLDGITDSMDMGFIRLLEMVKDREAWHAVVHGVAKTWLSSWTAAKGLCCAKPRMGTRCQQVLEADTAFLFSFLRKVRLRGVQWSPWKQSPGPITNDPYPYQGPCPMSGCRDNSSPQDAERLTPQCLFTAQAQPQACLTSVGGEGTWCFDKSMGFALKETGFKCGVFSWLAIWLSASYLTELQLSR